MIITIYTVILIYFLVGGLGFYFINRKRRPEEALHNRVKYISYFVIINVLFFSIVAYPLVFRMVCSIILIAGLIELYELFRLSAYLNKGKFIISSLVFVVFAFFFFIFSGLDKGIMLFTFLIVSIFDSFSQITGQIWGHTKLVPRVSPGKTIEGLAGGTALSLVSALLLRNLVPLTAVAALILSVWIVLFAFAGDLMASYYKRMYSVKDFSNVIPGHGGFLDRFDSLIPGGAGVALMWYSGIFNYL